ncbi:MAG: MFS transporter [Elusimicrobia bacterium]|nr:MFS transporter [Elusimicrobiota bacterium]
MVLPPAFWLLIGSEALMTAGYAVSFPFLALYLTGHRGVPMAWVGLFLSLSMLVASVAHVAGGEISDAIGRKKVMVLSLVLRAVLIAIIAWVIYSKAGLWAIYVFHPLGMLVGSFFQPAARSWVADYVPPSQRMKAYGLLRMGGNAGWAVGPAIGGLLAAGSYAALFGVTAAVYAVCAVIVFLSVKDKPGEARGGFEGFSLQAAAGTLRNKDFLRFCVFTFTMCAVMSQLVVATSLYSKTYLGFSERQIGLLFTINGSIVVLMQYFVTRFVEGWRITTGLTVGALFYAAGYLGVGYAYSFYFAAAAIVVVTLGEVAVSPGIQALGANMAGRHEKGRYLGVQGLFQQVGSAMGIFIGSNAIDHLSPHFQQGPWFLIAFLASVSAAGFWSLGGSLTRSQNGLKDAEEMITTTPTENPEAA